MPYNGFCYTCTGARFPISGCEPHRITDSVTHAPGARSPIGGCEPYRITDSVTHTPGAAPLIGGCEPYRITDSVTHAPGPFPHQRFPNERALLSLGMCSLQKVGEGTCPLSSL